MFTGTLARNILLHFDFSRTFLVICHEKHRLQVEMGDLVEGVAHSFFFIFFLGTVQ